MANLFDIAVARKLSGGGGGGAHIFVPTGSPMVLDKTFAEIKDMIEAGVVIWAYGLEDAAGYSPIRNFVYDTDNSSYSIHFGNGGFSFIGSSPNDYPTEDMG